MSLMEMSQLLGNFGEFVGAIAVVVTLGYLAVQIRQNTHSQIENRKAVVAQSARDIDAYIANWHLEMARDEDLKRIMEQSQSAAKSKSDFTDAEWYEFHCLAASLFMAFQMQYINRNLEVGFSDQVDYQLGIAKGMVTNLPVWKEWWHDVSDQHLFADGFIQAVSDVSGYVPSMQNVFPTGPTSG